MPDPLNRQVEKYAIDNPRATCLMIAQHFDKLSLMKKDYEYMEKSFPGFANQERVEVISQAIEMLGG